MFKPNVEKAEAKFAAAKRQFELSATRLEEAYRLPASHPNRKAIIKDRIAAKKTARANCFNADDNLRHASRRAAAYEARQKAKDKAKNKNKRR